MLSEVLQKKAFHLTKKALCPGTARNTWVRQRG